METKIKKFEDKNKNDIISIWKQSVKATHFFLKTEDIEFYKSIVTSLDFNDIECYCLYNELEMIGFLGKINEKLEMLFLLPNYIGKGYGKIMLEYAITKLRINEVDVNEQNTSAINFYKKFGFKIISKSETDAFGKHYPILTMRLE